MELKVWVEGIQRIVCGVTSSTTCQDVVFALAHATGKVGRFTLIERWRNNERLLAPTENPLKILLKWGEYSNDVQFILQRSESKNDSKQQAKNKVQGDTTQAESKPTEFVPLETSKNKAFGIGNEPKQVDNVGIVKGIQQVPPMAQVSPKKSPTQATSNNNNDPLSSSGSYVNALSPHSFPQDENLKYKSPEFNMADVRSSLDRKTSFHQDGKSMSSSENLVDVFNSQKTSTPNSSNNNNISNSINNELMPQISTNGSLVPPPYRDPPPPRTSPLQKIDNLSSKKYEFKDSLNISPYFNVNDFTNDMNENYLQSAQYKELIQLIKYQRDKISTQQSDLTKVDAEIVYLENKERDQVQQLDALAMEISKTDQILRQGTEQLQTLQYVEEENELVRQQEKTLKSEITLLRSKLANCETELLQCKNKIRLLLDDIQIEQRALNNRQKDNRQQMERSFLTEVERIQSEIDQAIQNSETSNKTMDNLKKEVNLIENAIAEKKRQVEQLVNEMKEVNLQSLAVAPSDEIRHLLESSNRPGSTRRIIGSPRQLENAVPTSKNPHGVWV